jgi:hypothetical protein
VGYTDHQTETCDDGTPNVIVHVLTTPAAEQDFDALPVIHIGLAMQGLEPGEHLVDAGYVTPQAIHSAATEHAITVIGPIRSDPRAKDRPRFAKADFHIDWNARTVTCPQGITSPPWKPTTMDRQPGIRIGDRAERSTVPAVSAVIP